MENENIIIMLFPEDEENITWSFRVPKKENINDSKQPLKKDGKIKSTLKDSERSLPKLLAEVDFHLLPTENPEEYKRNKAFLEKNLSILRVNFNDSFCGEYIKKLIPKVISYIKGNKQKGVYIRNDSLKKTIISNNSLSKSNKILEIEHQLKGIKKKINNINMTETEKKSILHKLQTIRNDIQINIQSFNKIDNIPGRLEQISCYEKKILK